MEEYFEYAEWKKLERLCLKRGLDFSDVVLDLYQAQNWLH
jgi:hypothetical protein